VRSVGRILGVDLGERRIGLAVSDPSGIIASPTGRIDRAGDRDADRRAIVAAAREHEADTIVVGLPTEMSGKAGPAARAARTEAEALAALAPDLTVELADERLTTVIAERALVGAGVRRKDRRQRIDGVAAAVMLQSYLDRRRDRP
jgi:putative Holliday junction resolvase